MSDATAGAEPPTRATDADRDRVVERLQSALGAGALTFDEIEERLDAVYRARTQADLAPLVADLPVAAPPVESTPTDRSALAAAAASSGFRAHLAVYTIVTVFLVLIWLISGLGYFWPIWPAFGMGVGLAGHLFGDTIRREQVARHRRARAARRRRRAERPAAVERRSRSGSRPPSRSSSPSRSSGPSRQFVAALFVDVCGSTTLNESMGDEGWARERDRLRTMCGERFGAEGGVEVSAAGDGFLARFEHPAAAVRSAIAIQRTLAAWRAEGFAPSVRIGIHSGDVIDEGDDIIGSVINLAARVNDAAAVDEILVTEHVADHVDDIEVVDRGLHELKGLRQARHLVAITWRAEG